MPQMATFATPGTPIRRGLIVQRAITDCSIGETRSEDSPIISTRLDDDSGWSSVGGFETCGSACAWRQALLHELAGAVDVGPGLEHEHDRRQAGQRLRADDVDALDPVQQVGLERDRDQLLHLSAESPSASVWISDVRRRELGQHVHRRVAELGDADGEHARGDGDDEEPEPQARPDDRAHLGTAPFPPNEALSCGVTRAIPIRFERRGRTESRSNGIEWRVVARAGCVSPGARQPAAGSAC